jgi:hypothetical protein
VVVAQDMWWWLRRICGGGGAGYLVGETKNKANSAQLELELGLSLAKMTSMKDDHSGRLPKKLGMAPGICTGEYKQLTMCTCVQCCSARPKVRMRRKLRPGAFFLISLIFLRILIFL